jgi:hypothetical protein
MHPAHSVDNYIWIYTDANSRKWVTHEELLLCGYRNISDFDIIYANDKFWELQGYVRAARSWWIEEVDTGEEATPYQSEAHEAAEGEPAPIRDDPESTGRGMRPLRKSTGFEPEA